MVPPRRKGALQPRKLDSDTTRAGGAGDLNRFEPSHGCRLWLSVKRVGDSHATEVDTAVAAVNRGEPSEASFEQVDSPPCLAEFDRTRGALELDKLNRAVATRPALAALLAEGGSFKGVVQLPVTGGVFPGNGETVGFLQERHGLHPCGKLAQPPLRSSCEPDRAGCIPLGRSLICMAGEHIRDDDRVACFMSPFHRPVGPIQSSPAIAHVLVQPTGELRIPGTDA